MDVGNPSNFVRILEIFHHEFPQLKSNLSSYSITDEETSAAIKDVFEKYSYIPDPHGAVGYLSLQRYLELHAGKKGIFLETAHPVKFPEAVENSTGKKIEAPLSVTAILNLEKKSISMKADYNHFKEYLLS
jgi:threonine synthase